MNQVASCPSTDPSAAPSSSPKETYQPHNQYDNDERLKHEDSPFSSRKNVIHHFWRFSSCDGLRRVYKAVDWFAESSRARIKVRVASPISP